MIIHIIFLLLLFSIYFLAGGNSSQTNMVIRRRQVTLMGFLLFLFAALRSPEVGIDVLGFQRGDAGYYLEYLQDSEMSFGEIFDYRVGRDPVFHCFLKVLSYLWPSPQFMLIVVGAIFSFGFSYFVYHSKGNVLLIYMMLIGFRIFPFSMSALRQAIALGIIYIAYIYLRDEKYVKYLILTGLAMLFHQSAMVFLLALLIMRIRPVYVYVSVAVLLLVNFVGGQVITYLASSFFGGRFDGYLARSANMEFEGGATFFIYISFYLLLLANTRSLKKVDPSYEKKFALVTVGIFFSIIGQSMDNAFRVAYYFIFLLFPATSLLLDNLFRNKNDRGMIYFTMSVLLAIQYVLLGPGAGTDNYQFFWTFNYFK